MPSRSSPSPPAGRPLLAAALTGVLITLSAPGILPARWPALLAWVAFAPLLRQLPRVSVPRAALLGWLAGLVTTLGTCAWFPGLLARFSGLHPLLAALLTVAIAAWQAAGWAAWAVVVRFASGPHDPSRPPPIPFLASTGARALLAAATFVVVERWLPAIFPSSLGITQYRFPVVAQSAELGGPYVLTFLCVFFSAVVACASRAAAAARRPPWRAAAAFFALLLLLLIFGLLRLHRIDHDRTAAPPYRVAAIQADVVRTGWNHPPDNPERLGRYQRLSADAERDSSPIDLLVWPEKAYPYLLRSDSRHDVHAGDKHRIRDGFSAPLLFGASAVDPDTRALANSAFLLLPDDTLRHVYDKVRLIFYSEHLPSWLSWLAGDRMLYRPGTRHDPVVLAPLTPLSVFICFEATFPDHVRQLVARDGRLLLNLSDDSWFGESAEPEQHLAHAVFRAIESRRDLVRATGSGVSAFVSAGGEILARTRVNRYAAEADVVLIADTRLLNVSGWYATLGDTFCWLCLGVTLLAVALALVRRRT